jgi:mannosyltransferase
MTASLQTAPAARAPIRIRDPRAYPVALIGGLCAVVLCAAGSWIPSFWGDEATSVMSAERPLPSLFRMLGNVDAVHGTYYLMLHYWIEVFGTSAFSVRFPSAIAAGLAVAGTIVLAERLSTFRVAVFAGLVALLLPRITYMGAEARSYSISAACAVWLTVVFVNLITRRDRRAMPWAAYSVLLAVTGYVFLFGMLIALAQLVIVFLVSRDGWIRRAWAIATAVAFALASPVIFYAVAERKQIAFLATRNALSFWNVLVVQWFGNIVFAVLAWALIVAAAIVAWRVLRDPLRRRSLRRLSLPLVAACWAFIPSILLIVGNAAHPVYSARYLSFAAPGAALLIGWILARIPGTVRLRRRVPRSVVALVVVLLAAVPSYILQRGPYAENNSDWAEVSATVAAHARPGDAIIFDESTIPSLRLRLAMHVYPQDYTGLDDVMLRVPFADNTWWWDGTYSLSAVTDRLQSVDRVWLLEYRAPGMHTDRYGMADLQSLGFRVTHSFPEHASTVYELERS